MRDDILVRGAREHNLKNVSARIPREKLTVITGLSGSGKSSLAFDTLYAEGQRRYVESLSAYARQFLDRMRKPDVDHIENLSPAIAIEQRTASANPRSLVATVTELHDYFRLLFGNVAIPHCPACGREVRRESAEQIVERLLDLPAGTRLILLAPAPDGEDVRLSRRLDAIRRRGFVRVRLDGTVYDVDAVPREITAGKADAKAVLEIVVDRLVVARDIRSRLSDSVELALELGDGVLRVLRPDAEDSGRIEVFSERNMCPGCGLVFDVLEPRDFSFNSPHGACPACAGLGTRMVFDPGKIVPDEDVSLKDGAVAAWRQGGRSLILFYRRWIKALAAHYGVSPDVPYRDLPESFRQVLLHGSGTEAIAFVSRSGGGYKRREKPFEGVIPNLRRRYASTDSESVRRRLRGYMRRIPCERCGGARLRPEPLAARIGGIGIGTLMNMTLRQAGEFFAGLKLEGVRGDIAVRILSEIRRRLEMLIRVGVEYLELDRESATLSGGEMQRIRLATQIGAGLVGVLYVLDEPTIGLHARDNERLISTLRALGERGNTVVVVEHDARMIREADHVLDLGPGAGADGGRLVYEGPPEGLIASPDSLTGRYLRDRNAIPVPARRREAGERGCLRVRGACANNLKQLDVDIPLGLFVCVTGVSGSGKSTLVEDVLRKGIACVRRGGGRLEGCRAVEGVERIDKVIEIDQSPIGRTPRGNPATYTGAFAGIRALFAATPEARMRGYGPGRFSFNVKGGRCEVCRGDGMLKLEMHFLPDVYVQCEQCGGSRFNRETLEIRFAGYTIHEVLEMTVAQALDVFAAVPSVAGKLATLADVGLGYLRLGQPANTLSGGEAQRVKLSGELARRATGRTLYLLDEPTTGLHFDDTRRLLEVLTRLRDQGNTVLVIEHNLDVIKCADYIMDLGPEGGEAGGHLVVCGTPETVAGCAASYTGRFLRPLLSGDPPEATKGRPAESGTKAKRKR